MCSADGLSQALPFRSVTDNAQPERHGELGHGLDELGKALLFDQTAHRQQTERLDRRKRIRPEALAVNTMRDKLYCGSTACQVGNNIVITSHDTRRLARTRGEFLLRHLADVTGVGIETVRNIKPPGRMRGHFGR